jgi:phospho-N-acetylmuramoyl-pentapeptide-transferase
MSLVITTVYGKRLIRFLLKKQVGETVRDLGLAGEQQKKGTPTMGGIIILLAILIPTLLFANLDKVYVRLMILSTVWLGIIGFIDDY